MVIHARSDLCRRVALVVLFFGLSGCGGDDPTGPGDDTNVQQFVQLMNQHRAMQGCEKLVWRQDVADVAAAHSEDMIARGYFAHTNPDGKGPGARLSAARIANTAWGENLARGTTDAGTVLDLWLNSPGHRANIEQCSFTQHGVGLVADHWTHVFIRNTTN
ncbi:MAG: CAP domain-containing protein [Gemmatimonadota bacterium]